MTLGFSDPDRRKALEDEVVGWELYQLQLDKYHAMFWFQNGRCLLNVAWQFAFASVDGTLAYIYDVQSAGGRKALDVDRILRARVARLEFPDEWELHMIFESGDRLIVFDQPHLRSIWFYRYDNERVVVPSAHVVWAVDDAEPAEMGRIDYMGPPLIPWRSPPR